MNHDSAGERLVRVEGDLEALPEAVGDFGPVALGRVGLHEPAPRLERAVRRGIAVSRHQCRGEPRARGAADVKRLGHRTELLAHADRLRRRDAERHRGLLRVEPEEPRGGCGGAQHAGRAGDMPSAVVVVGIDRVADAALDVDPDHDRIDERAPRRTEVLGERQRRRRDGAGGVDDRPQVRIVVIERVRGDSVDERRARDVDALAAAQYRRLGAGRELATPPRARHLPPDGAMRRSRSRPSSGTSDGPRARRLRPIPLPDASRRSPRGCA